VYTRCRYPSPSVTTGPPREPGHALHELRLDALDALDALDTRAETVAGVGGHGVARPCGPGSARGTTRIDPPPQPVLHLAWDAGAAGGVATESSEDRLAGLAAAGG
jgi:hypothetical protein